MIRSNFPPQVRMSRVFAAIVLFASVVCTAAPARAQVSLAGFDRLVAYSQEKLGDKHYRWSGSVELERGDTSIYADSVEFFEDQERAIATGNVVVTQGQNRIASDRADFNTRTQLGTFYNATGIATLRPPRPQAPAAGGIAVPPMTGQDNDVYYFGETVEKVGLKKYKITNGGFSTCVQPTPRWDLSADTIILNMDHYTLLRNMLLNVKGVPMLYLPVLYYPTKEEERATGILIPTYGVSTLRGQSIHNAFFWAIDRSQDATFLYDWFSKTGNGTGGEYRYIRGGGSDGQVTAYMLNDNGAASSQAAERSYTVRGNANQILPNRFRARGQIDYFSSIRTNQTFNVDVNDASRNRRSYSGNLVGTFSGFSLNGHFRSDGMVQHDNEFCHRRHLATGRAHSRRAAVVRAFAGVFRRVDGVRPSRSTNEIQRDSDRRPHARSIGRGASDPLSVQALAVSDGEFHAGVARHVLHAQPGSRREAGDGRQPQPAVLYGARAVGGPGLHTRLEYAGERLR